MTLFVAGFSMTAMAQRDDNQNRPKKDPPVIVAPDKDKPKDRPKDDDKDRDRPKKPQVSVLENRSKNELVAV